MPGINIVLEATSHPEFGDIHIERPLYPIGREEETFVAMDAEVRSKLSRRHARLFVEDQKVYLTDLDSSNGTVVNGKALAGGSPRVIHDGDLVTFSGELSYRVKLVDIGADVEANSSTEEQLVLEPTGPEGQLDTLIVNQFPFLIGRKDSVFESYAERFPDETAHLSRRHAIITLQDGSYHIEDLGSKNGTEVNGVKLDEHSKILSRGDSISFGNKFFAYSVEIPAESAVSSVTDAANVEPAPSDTGNTSLTDASTNREHTLFVDSPSSFLDAFCGEDESSDVDEEDGAQKEAGANASQDGHLRAGQARAIGEAFMGERVSRSILPRPFLTGLAAALALVVFIIWYPGEKDRIEQAYERGDYQQSAKLADAYLTEHPDDTQIEEKGTEAALKALLSQWLTHLEKGDYGQASAGLDKHRGQYTNLPDAIDAIALLRWVGALDQFMAENGGPSGPIDIFEDELVMAPLIDTWDKSPNRHQQVLSFISSVEPKFEPVRKEAMSRIRVLDHSFNSHKKTISSLSDIALKAIQSGDMSVLYIQLTDTRKNYPRLRGLDDLEHDAKSYAQRLEQLEEADIGVLVTLKGELEFQTDMFRENALPRIMAQLPDNKVHAVYSQSVEAWQQGESEAAIETLGQLERDTQWSEKVQQKKDRFTKIAAQYSELQADPDALDYPEKLLAFRGQLDAREDVFYLQATSDSFEAYEDQLLQDLQKNYTNAKNYWAEYEASGGISSVMRIEDPISESFRRQCTRLELALTGLDSVVGTYRSLHTEIPSDVASLHQLVHKEAKRQRSWINDLAVVLDEDLLRDKLFLLPDSAEDTQP